MDKETKTALAGQGYDEVLSDGVLVSPQRHLEKMVAPTNVVVPAVVEHREKGNHHGAR